MLENQAQLANIVSMKNKEPQMITLPVNAAHLMSLSGMLREYAPEGMHSIFSAQVAHQAAHQGLDVFSLKATDYDILLEKTLNFSIPANCIADVGNVLVDACESVDDDSIESALVFLIELWQPFAVKAVESLSKDEFLPHNRISDFGPEDLN